MPKSQKNKRRGIPNQHIDTSVDSPNLQPSSTIESSRVIAKDDQERRNFLLNIQQMRKDNAVPKHKIKSMGKQAANFVNGIVNGEPKNKRSINWMRGQRFRCVKWEAVHKQKNEKASIYKGHKLKMALDAFEQIYLDRWDEENILAHLNGSVQRTVSLVKH